MKIFRTHAYVKSRLSKWIFRISLLMLTAGIVLAVVFISGGDYREIYDIAADSFLRTYTHPTERIFLIAGIAMAGLGILGLLFSGICDAVLPTSITKINPDESTNPYLIHGNMPEWYGKGAVPNIQKEAERHIPGNTADRK